MCLRVKSLRNPQCEQKLSKEVSVKWEHISWALVREEHQSEILCLKNGSQGNMCLKTGEEHPSLRSRCLRIVSVRPVSEEHIFEVCI